MKIKIQSISDIITNSSSEIFTIYTKNEIQTLKEMISEIFDEDFDNLFVIDYEIRENDHLDKDFYSRNDQEQSYEDWALKHDENLDYDEIPAIIGIYIRAKNPQNKNKAKALNTILNLFERVEIYC